MKIAILAHSVYPISQPYRGGLEKFIHTLAEGLVKQGVDVTLFCHEDSMEGSYTKVPFTKFEYKLDNDFDELNRDYKTLTKELIGCKDFDLIHNNSLNTDLLSLSNEDTPLLTTLHVPAIEGFKQAVYANFFGKNNYLNIVSASCLKGWDALQECKVIHNCIDTSEWENKMGKREGAIWFGRICPEKGVERSMQAAIAANLPIKIAGPINDQDYFNYLRVKYKNRFEHIGLCTHKELNKLIATSEVFIKAPTWEEPFGLVYLEALACGTPVATYNSNIANEILNNKVAAITDKNIKSLGEGAMYALGNITSKDCVNYVKENFDIGKMIQEYKDYYTEIIKNA